MLDNIRIGERGGLRVLVSLPKPERTEAQLRTVFNDGGGARHQVKFDFLGVVDANLVRLESQLALSSVIDKGRASDTSCVDFAPSHVLAEELLADERQVYLAICEVFEDDAFFAFVFFRCLLNDLVSEVLN